MISLADIEAMKRQYMECVCCAGDCAGLSVSDSIDVFMRQHSRLLSEAESMCIARDKMLAELKHSVVLPVL